MKRKVYETDRRKKSDQRLGCIAFPLVNAVLWLLGMIISESTQKINAETMALILAWIVNGLVLVLAFIFRPDIGVGYIVSVALTMCATMVMGVLFLASCVAGLAVALSLEGATGATTGVPLGHVLGYLAGFGLFFGGLYLLYRWVNPIYRNWWASAPRDIQSRKRTKRTD